MKALSVKQPWAWLICTGYKDIENRSRPTSFRGRIYIHAGKQFDYDSWCKMLSGLIPGASNCQLTVHERFYARNGDHLLGAIIGEVDIVDCVSSSTSPWFTGPWGLVLSDPVAYSQPFPCKGKLGFFSPPANFT